MLRAVGLRGLLAPSLAPACSTAVLGSGAILAQLLGVRWGLLPALVAVALGVAAAALIGRFGSPPTREERLGWGERGAIGAGLALATVPALLATGSVDAYLQRWDAVFHLSALRLIEEAGSASSLTLGSLSFGDGHAAPYPAGWHALAALLPGSPTAALNLGSTVTASLPWVLGCAALAVQLARWGRSGGSPGIAGAAGLLAGLVTATPMSLWIGWGHVPNAAALAMVPGALALGLRLLREPAGRLVSLVALLVALLGIGITHPNAVLAWGVLLLPALTATVVTATRAAHAAGQRSRAIAMPVLAVAAAAASVAALLLSPLGSAVIGYAGGTAQSLGSAILEVVTGQYRLWSSTTGAVVGLVALASAVAAVARGRWLAPAMLVLTWLLYLEAATGAHLGLSGLWYSSPARLSVVVTIVVVPLAAGGVVAVLSRWRERAGATIPAVVALLVVIALSIPSVTVRGQRTASVYEAEPGNPPQFVTTGELEMIADLPAAVDGVVLGSPFSGASSAYGLVGLPVVFPVAGQVWSADQELVMTNVADVAAGTATTEVCDAVERLEVRYLYQDSVPYQVDHRYTELDAVTVAGDLVAEGDTAQVWRLPACDQ